MAKHKKYTPKHRVDPAVVSARRAPKRLLRTGALLTGLAAAATGVSVTGGVLAGDGSQSSTAAVGANRINLAAEEVEREPVISRSDTRGSTDAAKAAELGQASGKGMSAIADMSGEDPREIAKALLTEFGFGQDQFGCLDSLYNSESHWRVDADNPNSSAYGIPQALTQLHDLPADYMTSAEAQIRWGLDYIKGRYGTPCNAYAFKRSSGFY